MLDTTVSDGRAALDALAAWLRSRYGGSRVLGVGHRVVHGGPRYAKPTIVTPEVSKALRELVPLAPLHQPHNLAAIEAVAELLPGVPQVACFDTSFHRGQPAVAELVPLPREIRRSGVQRYGFHGLSYEYIASVLPRRRRRSPTTRDRRASRSGASLCAMRARKSVDSTLGFTALDGLCHGDAAGALDPGVVLHLFQGSVSGQGGRNVLYKKSGLLGISGISKRHARTAREPRADRRARRRLLRLPRRQGDRRAGRGARGGIDGLVFTAGIARTLPRSAGASARHQRGRHPVDGAANARGRAHLQRGEPVSAWVIPTNGS